tara:strand:- start:74 stop:754 length:681 start_codon:yes stop_codon:yes gene_type:complete
MVINKLNFLKVKIFISLTLIVLLVLVFVILRYREGFSPRNLSFKLDDKKKTGFHTVVDVVDLPGIDPTGDSTKAYDLDYYGPYCLGTCVMEHVPNINYMNEEGTDDLLKFNIENPTKGYCYRANDEDYPFLCEGEDCRNKCSPKNTNLKNYNYEMDFSQCESTEEMGCVERKLNISTGHGLQNTVGCKDCVFKYKKNLDTLMEIFKKMKKLDSKCSSKEKEDEKEK